MLSVNGITFAVIMTPISSNAVNLSNSICRPRLPSLGHQALFGLSLTVTLPLSSISKAIMVSRYLRILLEKPAECTHRHPAWPRTCFCRQSLRQTQTSASCQCRQQSIERVTRCSNEFVSHVLSSWRVRRGMCFCIEEQAPRIPELMPVPLFVVCDA